MQRVYRDNITLAYDESGSGGPPALLVHGWTHDHTYMREQAKHYGRRHRVVSVDLRGHGDSDKPEQAYTISGFADDLAWIIREVGLHRPIVIGHSMGGAAVLDLAARYSDLLSAAVLLDPTVFIPADVRDSLAPTGAALRSGGFREAQRNLVNAVSFLPTDDAALREQIVEHMSSAPQHVMASCWEGLVEYDAAPAAAATSVPLACIFAAHPIADRAAFSAANPRTVFGQTIGAGHYHHLLVPDQVNSMIDRFLAISELARAPLGSSIT